MASALFIELHKSSGKCRNIVIAHKLVELFGFNDLC